MKQIASALALLALCISLPSCGGGGGGSDGSPSTVRPKTLDGITFSLDSKATFRFTRSIGSGPAETTSDVETGVFTYTGNSTPKAYNSTQSNITNVIFPRSITSGTYTYQPTNSVGGTLTLTGNAIYTLPTQLPFPFNPVLIPFISDSDGNENRVVTVNVTFVSSGSFISANSAVVSVLGGGDPDFDSVVVPATVTLTSGGGVPPNYNPTLDPNRPSVIAPATLNNAVLTFESGTNNPAFDFSLQLAADASGTGSMNVDEIGQAILTVNGTIITNSEAYTYKRTPGTDDAVLVLSGSGSAVDGSYVLSFSGTQVGTYAGSTPDLSGSFVVVTPGIPTP